MWCDKCQAEVAAIASSENSRLFCTACGNELTRPAGGEPRAAESAPPPAFGEAASARTLRDPRELLARWAREDALEPLDLVTQAPREPSDSKKSVLRFDGAHPMLSSPPAQFMERAAALDPDPVKPTNADVPPAQPVTSVVHPAHRIPAPHFQRAPVSLADKSSKWVTLVGQLFAYFGVGGLTVGTVLVLMGHFGGPSHYATTGWLVTTAGQMLLFLGVVTLVSGGMEQTTQEVARRIDTLGDRLVRIEHATGAASARPSGEEEG